MSDNPEFVDIEQGKAAIKQVRTDTSDTTWCLFSYDGPKKIVLIGKGNGGLNELKSHLKHNMVGYGLVRRTDKIDESITIKFVYVVWIGEDIPRMQRARLGVHSGAIKEFIGQYHIDITASHTNELTDEILQEKIMDTSGSGSRVMDSATGATQLRAQSQGGVSSNRGQAGSGSKGVELSFSNRAELKSAIDNVRSGNKDWVLFGYEGGNSNTVILLGTGTGGMNELVNFLSDDIVVYGLIRKVEQIDDTQATKFAFIKFQGENIPRMLRARIGTHMGEITEFFSPFHVTLDVTHKNELSDDIVLNTIKNASGTRVHVLADEQTQKTVPIAKGTTGPPIGKSSNTVKVPTVPKNLSQEQTIKFVDEEKVRADIKDVRNDNTDTNWVLVGYEGKKGNTLVSLGKGSGGINELVQLLENDMVGYGLVRKTEQIDESLTVKFVHVVFIGEEINRMHKARLGTHKGAVNSLFAPYHVDVEATVKSELSDAILMKKIQEASGTAQKVKG